MTLTDRMLRSLAARGARFEVADPEVPGLRLRVSPDGAKVWSLLYRAPDGRKRRKRIGAYPGVSLADARAQARRDLRERDLGRDPGKAVGGPTVAEAGREYLDRYARPRKRSWREDERILRADVLPALGRTQVDQVTRADVQAVLDRLVDRGAPIQANRTRALLSRFFGWAVERGLLDSSPVVGTRPPARERSRDRVLTADELRAFWAGLAKLHPTLADAFRFRLLTLARGAEVIGARWADFEAGAWAMPAALTKQGRPHKLPLAPLAAALLASRPKRGPLVFPSPRTGKRLSSTALDHALRRLRPEVPADVRGHDLRRTGATVLASLGVPRPVVRTILGHADPEVTGRYDRHDYLPEALAALSAWEGWLASVLGTSPSP